MTALQAPSVITGQNISLIIVFRKKTTMDTSVQLYNVLFNRIMKTLKMARVGFSWYMSQGSALVPQHKLEIWPGFVSFVLFAIAVFLLSIRKKQRHEKFYN